MYKCIITNVEHEECANLNTVALKLKMCKNDL